MERDAQRITRRSMVGVIAGAAAVAALPRTSLLGHGASASAAPDLVTGTLQDASAHELVVHTGSTLSPTATTVALNTSTVIQRRGRQDASALVAGDRVEVALQPGAGLVARSVVVNPVTGTAVISRIDRGIIYTQPSHYQRGNVVREIVILPSTRVTTLDGRSVTGSTGSLQPGDTISFTATAQHPSPYTVAVWGLTVTQVHG